MDPELVGMSEEQKALAYLSTRPGWDLLKQICAQEKMVRLNQLADRSKKRRDTNPDDSLWGEIRGMEFLIRRVEDEVSEAAQRELEMLNEQGK